MEFLLDHSLDDEAARAVEHEIWRVDPDAKVQIDRAASRVTVDSWLFPEEFVVAFEDAGFTVRINDH
ncbi:hypothetical protein KTE28_25365 [Burkholderia multivorans]|uniref:hypothetical protein n=1 Tax=Burkholderia multivorans TaxID=87883 RepID=UPI001C273A8A|nr:hypothetical protein [Burkholderia multivorans]MBU9377665.1 hypothetical protein [Burkholderia multivorans]MDN7609990.1 hypothetical protein [Burkholderia multivorans]